jgi:hypothetical protein
VKKKDLKKALKAADKLVQAIDQIMSENDNINPNAPRAAVLPSEWRSPLVRWTNVYRELRGKKAGIGTWRSGGG